VNILQNSFFKLAMSRAANLAGKPGRILSLLTQLALKIRNTKGKSINIQTLRDHFFVIGRMLKAHVSGTYKIKSTKLVLTLLAAVIYFVNPLDLIPDLIFGVGLMDDFAVLTWVYQSASEEIENFKRWEQSVNASSSSMSG
jgi:uncharacterized membrane protein YkvA (DUF1232 family)